MPTYEYLCDRCFKTHEDQRPIAERHTPMVCPDPKCEGVASFVISAPAGSFPGASRWRTVMKSRGG
jgi:putative FmdB family regulatory protein